MKKIEWLVFAFVVICSMVAKSDTAHVILSIIAFTYMIGCIILGKILRIEWYLSGNNSGESLLRQLVAAYSEAETKRDLEPIIQRVERFLDQHYE